jgi:hypothetical protein
MVERSPGPAPARVREPLPRSYREVLRDIAQRVQRLQQDYSDPRRYYDRRDTLADEIDALTR